MAISFEIKHRLSDGAARAGILTTPHGAIETPVFMPVGTKATVKAMTPEDLVDCGAQIVLANTFHLFLRPGDDIVRDLGGLHKIMNWPHPILTDSGGFQVFSLSKLNKIREEGVHFRSPLDGSPLFLSPEKAVEIQENLGADMIMCFDECCPYPATHDYARNSAEMTLRWAERCKGAQRREDQALFGIVQGSVFSDLRQWSAQRTIEIGFPGYSIGGLSVGESKEEMAAALDVMNACLPHDQPRYLMGVGTPEDFFLGVERGVDMFDCVLPTRSARNGRLYTNEGLLNIRNQKFARDAGPISSTCQCYACRHYCRGYIRHLFMSDEILAPRLGTIHNLYYFISLMTSIRRAVAGNDLKRLKEAALAPYSQAELLPDLREMDGR